MLRREVRPGDAGVGCLWKTPDLPCAPNSPGAHTDSQQSCQSVASRKRQFGPATNALCSERHTESRKADKEADEFSAADAAAKRQGTPRFSVARLRIRQSVTAKPVRIHGAGILRMWFNAAQPIAQKALSCGKQSLCGPADAKAPAIPCATPRRRAARIARSPCARSARR